MQLITRNKTGSYARQPVKGTRLDRLIGLSPMPEPGESGFQIVNRNDNALAWRIMLIDNADQSIDAQYYSWHFDTSGLMLIGKLINAADRGVRVRLLLDDMQMFGRDRRFATLNSHENIEVRLFNPFRIRMSLRFLRTLELLINLGRLNHRMHNKMLIVDNQAAIIGGRNIGDEYFGLSPDFIFRDLDVVVSGSSVKELSASFDVYWNCKHTKTARRLIAFRPRKADFNKLRVQIIQFVQRSKLVHERINATTNELFKVISTRSQQIRARARVIYDLPTLDDTMPVQMANALQEAALKVRHRITIISAYLVPSPRLMKAIETFTGSGKKVRIYTNSLASTDVTATFCGYERYRHQFLRFGVSIAEFRFEPANNSAFTTPMINVNKYSLHAKSIIYDDHTVYIGTLNIDPRSTLLNTETGILIESPEIAAKVLQSFEQDEAGGSFWQVRLNDENNLQWNCGEEKTTTQPARNLLQRISNFLYSMLPIESQL